MKLNRSLIEVPLTVAKDTIVSAIILQLYSMKVVPNALDVVDIEFEDMTSDPLKMKLIFKEEVDTITF